MIKYEVAKRMKQGNVSTKKKVVVNLFMIVTEGLLNLSVYLSGKMSMMTKVI